MKKERISVTVNTGTLTHAISAEADFPIPEGVGEWSALLGADSFCALAKAEYVRRAKTGLRSQVLSCIDKATGKYAPDQDRLQKFADEFRPDILRRNKARRAVEKYLSTVTDEEFERLLKEEAVRRGIEL